MYSTLGLGLAIMLFAVEGCYRLVPVAAPQPLPGTHVAAALTDAGSAELAPYLGKNVASVGGRLVNSSPEELQISVLTVAARDGQESFWKGEMVTLPRRLVAGIQERKFSGSRSGFVATLGLVAGVGLLRVFGVLSAGGTAGGGGGVVTK
jgi:hypothetical protein